MVSALMGKLGKIAIFSVFAGILTLFCILTAEIVSIFPDYRIIFLCESIVVFICILAIKRGVWH